MYNIESIAGRFRNEKKFFSLVNKTASLENNMMYAYVCVCFPITYHSSIKVKGLSHSNCLLTLSLQFPIRKEKS